MTDTIVATTTKPENSTKRKRQPPYTVILLNDDEHTFEYVVEIIQKVFKRSTQEAKALTMDIHKKGLAHVWSGTKELAELKVEQVQTFRNDPYSERPVKYPLGVVMEPLPQ